MKYKFKSDTSKYEVFLEVHTIFLVFMFHNYIEINFGTCMSLIASSTRCIDTSFKINTNIIEKHKNQEGCMYLWKNLMLHQ